MLRTADVGASLLGKETKLDNALYAEPFLSLYSMAKRRIIDCVLCIFTLIFFFFNVFCALVLHLYWCVLQ